MMILTRITAKFPGKCASSGAPFEMGTTILHDPVSRRCFLPGNEPEGATVTVPLAGAKSKAYTDGWAAGAPGAPMTTNPHPAKSPEARMWTDGLRDRHKSGN